MQTFYYKKGRAIKTKLSKSRQKEKAYCKKTALSSLRLMNLTLKKILAIGNLCKKAIVIFFIEEKVHQKNQILAREFINHCLKLRRTKGEKTRINLKSNMKRIRMS
jgi:hypothetical protein